MNARIVSVLLAVGCSAGQKSGSNNTRDPHAGSHTDDSSSTTADDSGKGTDSGSDHQTSHCADGTNPSNLGKATCMNQSACLWQGTQNHGNLGFAIDLSGDVNGDGRNDLLVGAPTEDVIVDDIVTVTDPGAVHLWFNPGAEQETTPAVSVYGSQAGLQLGYAVAIVPDINGDGFDDIVVGGRGNNVDGVLAGGTAWLLLGRADWSDDITPDHEWTGNTVYSRVGSHVQGSEDLNGDGLGDLLISTHQNQVTSSGYETQASGKVAIIYGQAVLSELSELTEPDVVIEGSGPLDGTGKSFKTGDVDGDGRIDILVGSPFGSSNSGRVDVFQGQVTPMSGAYSSEVATITLEGNSGSSFGYALSTGDLNDDGIAEIIVGAPLDDWGFDDAGSLSVYTGGPTIFEGSPAASSRFHGEFDDTQLGHGIHAGADLNGDGFGDLVVGSLFTWKGLVTKGGRVYGMHGPHTDWTPTASIADVPIQVFGAASKDYLGRSNWAGDINGDGKAELFMGTGFSNTTRTFDSGSVVMFWGK